MAARYWVGSTDTWNGTAGTKWAETSGGVGGASVPTAADDVFFDANSGVGTVTLSASSVCRSLNCTGFAGTLSHPAATTVNIGDATAGAGNIALKLVSGMTYTLGNVATSAINFISTSATVQTIDSGGKNLGNITFNGVGGSWQLTSGLTIANTATLTLTQGTLNTNGQACSWGLFNSNNSNTRTLTLGASVITMTGAGGSWELTTSTNMTLNPGTSLIDQKPTTGTPSFAGGGLTYYDVTVTRSSGGWVITGNGATFRNLTHDNTVVGAGNRALDIRADITVTGVFTYIGNSESSRGLMATNIIGTQRTIALGTTGTVNLNRIDFRDIAFIGTNAPATGTSLADGGGNSGITFSAPRTLYWVGNGGSLSDSAKWSETSGGAGGAVLPNLQDTLVFDANSITAASQSVSFNLMRIGNLDASAVANNPTFNFVNPNGAGNSIYGNLVVAGGVTIGTTGAAGGSSTVFYWGRGTQTLRHNGVAYGGVLAVTILGVNGTYTLLDDMYLTDPTRTLTLSLGTFDANGFNVTTGLFSSSGTGLRTLKMGSGTWTLNGTGNIWNSNTFTNLTHDAGTSTIVIADTSASAKSFLPGSTDNPAFYNLTVNGGGTGSLTINSSCSFNNVTINGPKTVILQASQTKTINGTFTLAGAAANTVDLSSSSAGTQTFVRIVGAYSFTEYTKTADVIFTYARTYAAAMISVATLINVLGKLLAAASTALLVLTKVPGKLLGAIVRSQLPNSLNFTGSVADYLIANPLNSDFPSAAFTLQGKIMARSAATDDRYFFSYNTSTIENAILLGRPANVRLFVRGLSIDTGINIDDDLEHDFAISWRTSDGQVKAYLDGTLVFTGTRTATTPNTGGSLVFGQDQDAIGGGFNALQAWDGNLRDWKIYNRELSDAEVATNVSSTPVANGLINRWPMGEGQGNTAFDIVGSDHLTINGATWATADNFVTALYYRVLMTTVVGVTGLSRVMTYLKTLSAKAYAMLPNTVSTDGIDDYIQIPHTDSINIGDSENFTVVTRFKTTAGGTDKFLVGKAASAGRFPVFVQVTATGQLDVRTYDGATTASGTFNGPYNDGVPHRLVLQHDSVAKSTAVWVDGISKGSVTGPGSMGSNLSNSLPFTFGALPNAGLTAYTRHLAVQYSQFLLFRYRLTNTEITNLESGMLPTVAPVANVPFGDGVGQAKDITGNGNNANLVGATWLGTGFVSLIGKILNTLMVSVPALDRISIFVRSLSVAASGVVILSRASQFFRTLAATGTSVITILIARVMRLNVTVTPITTVSVGLTKVLTATANVLASLVRGNIGRVRLFPIKVDLRKQEASAALKSKESAGQLLGSQSTVALPSTITQVNLDDVQGESIIS